ncbi:MAG: D-alanine--D-alanine ligase [Patescibacteria group bacterium]|jgi:D-alanine-D-alanine ligase
MNTPFKKGKVRVGVLMGGLSAERAVSIASGQGILNALRERGWNAVEVLIDRHADKTIRNANIDVAFVALHGKFGEDGCVQGLLETMGIPYTGSGVQASASAMDKLMTHQVMDGVASKWVEMAEYLVVRPGWEPNPGRLSFPLMVKPRNTGSSIGITKVKTREELVAAVTKARKFDSIVLVEKFIQGEEITVPVLNGRALSVVSIEPKSGIFSFESKYQKGEAKYECPAQLAAHTALYATTAAETIHKTLGCRGLSRVDFIIPDAGRLVPTPIFLEINTIPGMTPTSLSPMSAAASGMNYGELCEAILQSATCEQEEFPPAA